MPTIDEVELMLDEIAEEIPLEFYRELNGGILLQPELKYSPEARGGDLFVMGMYHRSTSMGRYIAIYYGSMQHVYGHLPPETFRKKLKEVLLHEFTHHVESLAGQRGLEIKDEEQLRRYRRRGESSRLD